jgi:hypothetical protein
VENWPFSRWSKSVRYTRAQLLLSAAMRCPSVTLNLYDHVGTPLYEEPQYGELLRHTRPLLDTMVEAYRPEGVERGVGILQQEEAAKHTILSEGAGYGDLGMGREPWADVLQALGTSVTFGESEVVAASGRKLQAHSNRLDEIFARGVLLDLSAVEGLLALGRGDLLGADLAETFNRAERVTPAEEPVDAEFGAAGGRYMTVDHLGLTARVGRYELKPGARAVSMLVNSDREPVMPGFVLYENNLGGRVALCPYDIGVGMRRWFMNWLRKRQMLGVLNWLFRGKLPLKVEGGTYALPILTQYRSVVLVSVLNLSTDDWPAVCIELHDERGLSKALALNASGRWRHVAVGDIQRDGAKLRVTVRRPLGVLDMLTMRLR